MEPDGFIVVDDYFDFRSFRQITDNFCVQRSISPPIQLIDRHGVFGEKRSVSDKGTHAKRPSSYFGHYADIQYCAVSA
ncbi:MAG: hypothetical protein HQK56_11020 [Deltaproteobacteria bacterium]|nr:hypothetical protein [Deltaproteobacteria bacterium]